MSDLTRGEIRQACEALKWERYDFEETVAAGVTVEHEWFLDGGGELRFHTSHDKDSQAADATAMLEAWRCLTFENPYRQAVITLEDPPSVRLRELAFDDDGEPAGDWEEWEHTDTDLPTAAVRAVNRAAEQPPQGEEAA